MTFPTQEARLRHRVVSHWPSNTAAGQEGKLHFRPPDPWNSIYFSQHEKQPFIPQHTKPRGRAQKEEQHDWRVGQVSPSWSCVQGCPPRIPCVGCCSARPAAGSRQDFSSSCSPTRLHTLRTQRGWSYPRHPPASEKEFRKALRVDPGNIIKSGRDLGFPRFWKCQNQAGKQNKIKPNKKAKKNQRRKIPTDQRKNNNNKKNKLKRNIFNRKQCCFLAVP